MFISLVLFLGFWAFVSLPSLVLAQPPLPVSLTIFYGQGCPHCAKEKLFLDQLENEFSNLKVRRLEVWYNVANANLMSQVGQKMNLSVSGVPLTIIGNQAITGYQDSQTTGAQIKQLVIAYSKEGCSDVVGEILGETTVETDSKACPETSAVTPNKVINIPFFGSVDFSSWSLPVLTIVIAGLDSFNPCAMWVLLFLISLLFGLADRKKMLILGSAFLLGSAASYFLFMAAWLNLFLFLGFIYFLRIGIGIFAIGSGIFYLREWYKTRDAGCHVTNDNQRKKIMEKTRQILAQNSFWLAMLGIMALAFVVNLIELVCSAGLPAIYTQVLALAKLSPLQYYLYLLLYIIIYILPSLIVFIIAMTTFRAFGFSTKYARWANFIGGIIILILGFLLIFRPGWIMFG
ncbi:MAG: hypothetical protein WC508_05115 [Patescibacteria group bacterium]